MPVPLNGSGQPAAPPPRRAVTIIYARVTGAAAAIAVVVLLAAHAVGRHALDRRRLAAWESAWAWTGPS